VKVWSEGLAPWRYADWRVNKEWKWNHFDFIIVLFCMPFLKSLTDGNAAVLRLMRLARLMKILKKVPQLQMIVMGLIGGLSSIGYIIILMVLVFYLYAIVGIFQFRENDPWHFGNLMDAMLSLFRASTLEDWTDIMYINIYGCDEYMNIYRCISANPGDCDGEPPMYWCEHAKAQPIFSSVYWVTFIVVSALVMLSLFVGAVTMSMSDSMADMKREAEETERKARLLKKKKRMDELAKENEFLGADQDVDETEMTLANMSVRQREEAKDKLKMKSLLLEAWEGTILAEYVMQYPPGLRGKYMKISEKCGWLATHANFVNFITLVIILAGVLVGMQTWPSLQDNDLLNFIDAIVLGIFTFEVVLKLIAEEFKPLHYFHSGWNTFDFIVVAGSFLPAGGDLVTMLRLLRLLRVLKLLKSLPALAIIVNALIMGLSSIGFIGVILFMVFYLFAILGMMLFKENDPWHFGTLHVAMLSLFRSSTMDDWTDMMYINIYGCDLYGYVDDDKLAAMCDQPTARGFLAAIYFVIFQVIGALVLLTLFIGVVTTSMEEATANQESEAELEGRVEAYAEKEGLTEITVENYRKVFALLDVDQGGTIEEDELKAGLNAVGRFPTSDELQALMKMVDEDESGEIDLAEFIEFMTMIKKRQGKPLSEKEEDEKEDRAGDTPYEESPVKMLKPGELEKDLLQDDLQADKIGERARNSPEKKYRIGDEDGEEKKAEAWG